MLAVIQASETFSPYDADVPLKLRRRLAAHAALLELLRLPRFAADAAPGRIKRLGAFAGNSLYPRDAISEWAEAVIFSHVQP
jgi:hypothetical protein